MNSAALSGRIFFNSSFKHKHILSHEHSGPQQPAYLLRCTASPAQFYSSCYSTAEVSKISSGSSVSLRLQGISNEFRSLREPIERVKRLLLYAADLPTYPEVDRVPSNRVTGCTAQVWLSTRIDALGRMRFAADSDSEIARGFCACLLAIVDGAHPVEVMAIRNEDLEVLNVVGISGNARSRVNTWQNVLISMRKMACEMVAEVEELPPVDLFHVK